MLSLIRYYETSFYDFETPVGYSPMTQRIYEFLFLIYPTTLVKKYRVLVNSTDVLSTMYRTNVFSTSDRT